MIGERRNRQPIPTAPLVSFLLCLVVAAVSYRIHRRQSSPGEIATAQPSPDHDDSASTAKQDAPLSRNVARDNSGLPKSGRGQVAASQVTAGPSRAERAEAARLERLLMAKTWKLTREQYEKFEAVATSPHSERGALYESMLASGVPREEVEQEVAKVDARDAEQLREALGQHYQEYTLMRGHFAEAGLDQKPFQPPVYEPTPPAPR